jgi:hypothetical protein
MLNVTFDEDYFKEEFNKPFQIGGFKLIRNKHPLNGVYDQTDYGALTLDDIYEFKKYSKQQIEIGLDPDATEKDLLKYFEFIGKLPPNAKVAGGNEGDFDGEYDLKKLRPINVFNVQEVKEYGEKCLLSFDKSYLIKKLPNGMILMWMRGLRFKSTYSYCLFPDAREEIKALEKHLKKCKLMNKKMKSKEKSKK